MVSQEHKLKVSRKVDETFSRKTDFLVAECFLGKLVKVSKWLLWLMYIPRRNQWARPALGHKRSTNGCLLLQNFVSNRLGEDQEVVAAITGENFNRSFLEGGDTISWTSVTTWKPMCFTE